MCAPRNGCGRQARAAYHMAPGVKMLAVDYDAVFTVAIKTKQP